MEDDLLEFLLTKVDCGELLLLIEVTNTQHLYQFIYDYELYGNYFEKMFELCEEDISLVCESYEMIKERPAISKEVVKNNLDLDDPIPFINPNYRSIGISAMVHAMSAISFMDEYEKKTKRRGRSN